MSKGIKTKATIKDVKALDKSAVAAERMKQAHIRTKDKAEHGVYAEESSPGEYASDTTLSLNVMNSKIHIILFLIQFIKGYIRSSIRLQICFCYKSTIGQTKSISEVFS